MYDDDDYEYYHSDRHGGQGVSLSEGCEAVASFIAFLIIIVGIPVGVLIVMHH
jgi:hypothetical protein